MDWTAGTDTPADAVVVRRESEMSDTAHATPRAVRTAERRARADYAGGVYGSMLAASVIIGAGTLGSFPRLELVLLLLLTGVAFWIAHVHAQVFGARLVQQRKLDRGAVLSACRDEWPIVKAAVPLGRRRGRESLAGPRHGEHRVARGRRRRGRSGGLVDSRGTTGRRLPAPDGRHRRGEPVARPADHLVQAVRDALTHRRTDVSTHRRIDALTHWWRITFAG